VPFDKEMAGNGSVQLIGDPSDQQAEVKTLTLTGVRKTPYFYVQHLGSGFK